MPQSGTGRPLLNQPANDGTDAPRRIAAIKDVRNSKPRSLVIGISVSFGVRSPCQYQGLLIGSRELLVKVVQAVVLLLIQKRVVVGKCACDFNPVGNRGGGNLERRMIRPWHLVCLR